MFISAGSRKCSRKSRKRERQRRLRKLNLQKRNPPRRKQRNKMKKRGRRGSCRSKTRRGRSEFIKRCSSVATKCWSNLVITFTSPTSRRSGSGRCCRGEVHSAHGDVLQT